MVEERTPIRDQAIDSFSFRRSDSSRGGSLDEAVLNILERSKMSRKIVEANEDGANKAIYDKEPLLDTDNDEAGTSNSKLFKITFLR